MNKLFKKILVVLMLICSFTFVACGSGEQPKLTDQDVVNAATQTLTINYSEVTTDFTLPTTAAGGVVVTWASNNEAVVISGQNAYVTRPSFEEGNVEVTLTATLTKNEASASLEFKVVVVCLEDVETIEALTVAEAIASEQGATVTVRGIVSGFHSSLYQDAVSIQACYLTDETGTIYVYGYLLAQSVEKGDDIVIQATVGEYKGYTQLTSPTLNQTISKGNEIPTEGAKTDKTVAQIAGDLAGNYTAAAYIFESVQIKKITGEDYVSYAVEDANGNAINVYSGASGVELAWLDEYLGKELKVLFAVNSQNSAGTKWRGHVLEVLEVVGDWDPELNENPDLGGEVISIADAVASEQGAVVTVKGIVSGFHYGKHNNAVSIQACYLTDETGTVYVYGYLLAQGVEKGDEITISATVGEYKGYTQLTSPNLVKKGTTGNEIPTAGAKTDKTLADIAGDLNGNYTACAYLFEGVQIVKITGSGYINYVVEDKAGNAINIYSSADSVEFGWLEEYLGKELKVLFAVNSQNSAGTKWRGHVLDVVEVVGDWEEAPIVTTEATISEVLAAGGKLASGATSSEYYIVSGEVVSVDEAYSSQYKNVTFTISDGTNTIQCYRTGGSTASVVAVGDTVTVKAQIENYEGTVELVYGEITERVPGEGNEDNTGTEDPATFEGTVSEVYNMVKDLAESETSVTVFTVTALVVDVEEYNSEYNNVTFYITDGTTEMYVYRATGTEAANLKKNDTVTIEGQVKNYFGTLEFVSTSITSRVAGEAEEEAVALATISFGDKAYRTEFSSSKQVWVQNGITVTNNQAASTSPVADYAAPARFYKSSDLTIAYESEFEMIVITTSGGKCYTGTETITGATLSVSAGKMTLVLDEKATSFTIATLATQIRATEISIFSEGTGNSGSEEGGNGDDSGNTETTTDYVTSLETGVAYKFAMVVGNGSTVYLTGKMSSYYGATSTNKADGKDVYLEAVEGGYNMYFMEGDVKTYIVVLVNDGHNNITFTTEASSVWVWDATYNTVTTVTSAGDKVFLGTYGTYSTFSPSYYESYIASNYVGRFYTVE